MVARCGADRDSAGVSADQAGTAEHQRDIVGDVMGEIYESSEAIGGCGSECALQIAAAQVAGGVHNRAIGDTVRSATQVSKLIAHLDDRLLGEDHTGDGGGRSLGLDTEDFGGAGDFAQRAEDRAGCNTGQGCGSAPGKVATGQRSAGGGTDPDILPGQLAGNA